MKKGLLFILLASTSLAAKIYAQNDKLYIAFKPGVSASNLQIDQKMIGTQSAAYRQLAEQYHLVLSNPFDFTEAKLAELSASALKLKGSDASVQQLKRIFRLNTDQLSPGDFEALVKQLERVDIIEYVSTMPAKPELPPADIAPVTPDYEFRQEYLESNPGVDIRYAWDQGIFGQNVRVRDVEYGVNINHEDLEDQPISIQPGKTISPNADTTYTEHGTAVLGIIAANKGAYGISGMVSQVSEAILYPEYTVQTGYDRALAVSGAIGNSTAGDVIVYEMQTGGTGAADSYVPAEYNSVIWNLTKAATDAGIVIVAAAGNGNQNLDDASYASYMNRGNSGAIIVGAGTNNAEHTRLSFSTYGSRVDVQAWGTQVFSTGYGNVIRIGGDFNQGYTNFSGTSSATPIVASCAIALQCYYRQLTGGDNLTGPQIRTILQNTGIPQGNPATKNIGPIPDMKAAMEYLATGVLSTGKLAKEQQSIFIYPNPATDRLYIDDKENRQASYRIMDIYGKSVFSSKQKTSHIDIGSLPAGIYFLELHGDRHHHYQKFIKQ